MSLPRQARQQILRGFLAAVVSYDAGRAGLGEMPADRGADRSRSADDYRNLITHAIHTENLSPQRSQRTQRTQRKQKGIRFGQTDHSNMVTNPVESFDLPSCCLSGFSLCPLRSLWQKGALRCAALAVALDAK